MKQNSFWTLLALGFTFSSALFAQKPQRVLDAQNMREGENVEYCITHKKHTALLQNPEYVKGLALAEAEAQEFEKKGNTQKPRPDGKIRPSRYRHEPDTELRAR